IARVLSLSAGAVPVDRPLSELGLDSLMAVGLRNALGRRVGAGLPAALAFNYPPVSPVTKYLAEEVLGDQPKATDAEAPPVTDAEIRRALASIPVAELRRTELLSRLLQLASQSTTTRSEDAEKATNIDHLSTDDLIRMFGASDSLADVAE